MRYMCGQPVQLPVLCWFGFRQCLSDMHHNMALIMHAAFLMFVPHRRFLMPSFVIHLMVCVLVAGNPGVARC